MERGEIFDDNLLAPPSGNGFDHGAPASQTANSNGFTDSAAASRSGDQNGDAHANIHASASSTLNISYEDAYIHGYKEGYAKSYVELKHQPIAIVGMSCRLPGNVSTPDEFWELLARSRTGFSSIPPSRFSANRFFHPNPGKSGTTNARGGNFLTHDLAAFDAPFFGFTQQEAISLDPQQRLLLECTFEALESAGIPKHDVVGKDIGVFVGGTFSEYEADLFRDPETIPMHQATGMSRSIIEVWRTFTRGPITDNRQAALWLCSPIGSPTSLTFEVQVLPSTQPARQAWSRFTRLARVFVMANRVWQSQPEFT